MQDYLARQPVMNSKTQVIAYRLALGRGVRGSAGEFYDNAAQEGQGRYSIFAELVNSLSEHKTAYIDYFEDLRHMDGVIPREAAEAIAVVSRWNAPVNSQLCVQLKAQGFRLAFDSTYFVSGAPEAALADVMVVEFTAVSLAAQAALIRKYRGQVTLLAEKIETWSDFRVARDLGYECFQGFFFLWPTGSLVQKDIKSLDVCLTGILQELEKPEPDFKTVSDMIEHDLGLSYKLLRLVNSAYMAPKYKVRSISQALTYLGTRELHQWISMLMFNGIRSEDNSELVVMSLIRGKMAALVAHELQLAATGSEPFFTGLFSLIDVIMNREMRAVLSGLPLSDDVTTALTGGGNALSALLEFVIGYEQANWQKIEERYPMNIIPPQRMVSIYIEALKWAKLLD